MRRTLLCLFRFPLGVFGWKEMVFYYNAHLDWFHRWLGGGAPPWDVEELARNRAFGKDGGWTKP